MHKAIILLVAAALLLLIAVLAAPYIPPMRDFDQTFYPAIRYTLAGENPYLAYYEETDQGAPPDFFSPFWLLIILLPVGLLPFTVARALWVLFLIGVTFAGVGLLKWWGLKGLWPLALVALPWSLIGILFGQVTAIVFFGAMLGVVEAAKGDSSHKSALVILLSLVLIGVKPQLGLFIALPLVLQMAWRRDRRLALVALGSSLMLGLTLVVTPPWLVGKAIAVQAVAPHWKSTLERELLLWQWPSWIAWAVRGFVAAVMVLWAWQARKLTPAWWSAWLAAVLIITPYTRAYDGVLLLPILGQLIARYRLRAFIFLVVVVLYAQISELGTVVTPLTAWLLFVPWRNVKWAVSSGRPKAA
ncbi:MAG TPA: hypothetical protein VF177_16235 [Anaerolineae bacterium]